MKYVEVKPYNPKKVFEFARDEKHPMCGYELAKGFYNARYNDAGNTNSVLGAAEFTSNAGAVQLFNINKHNPYPTGAITWKNKNNEQKGVFSGISDCLKQGSQRTTYGHSERICMRDLLDSYMAYKEIDPHDLSNPSDNFRDPNTKKLEILEALTNNASKYKLFLVGSGVIVKFWSEFSACSGKENQNRPGSICSDFIEKICPIGSKYGYIIDEYIEFKDRQRKVAEISKLLKEAYHEDKNMDNMIKLTERLQASNKEADRETESSLTSNDDKKAKYNSGLAQNTEDRTESHEIFETNRSEDEDRQVSGESSDVTSDFSG